MKTWIRQKVFETNSSSSHSLTINPEMATQATFSPAVQRKGVYRVAKGEYGWDWKMYCTLENKLRYLFTQLFSKDIDYSSAEEATAALRSEEPRFDLLCRLVEEHTGVRLLAQAKSSGYIDHQSEGVGLDLFLDEQRLKSFLFNEESFVGTGNDNSYPGWTMRSDRGPKLTFARFIKEIPEDSATIQAEWPDKWGPLLLRLTTGGVVSEEDNAELLYRLTSESVVSKVVYTETGKYPPSKRNYTGEVAQLLTTRLESDNLSFSLAPDFKVEHRYLPSEELATKYLMTLHVPHDLAEALKALPSKRSNKSRSRVGNRTIIRC
jgi:hypothetical protein